MKLVYSIFPGMLLLLMMAVVAGDVEAGPIPSSLLRERNVSTKNLEENSPGSISAVGIRSNLASTSRGLKPFKPVFRINIRAEVAGYWDQIGFFSSVQKRKVDLRVGQSKEIKSIFWGLPTSIRLVSVKKSIATIKWDLGVDCVQNQTPDGYYMVMAKSKVGSGFVKAPSYFCQQATAGYHEFVSQHFVSVRRLSAPRNCREKKQLCKTTRQCCGRLKCKKRGKKRRCFP